MDDHLFIIAYDIADQKRWRAIFRLLHGYGEWLQLSVFQCRLSRLRHAELIATLDEIIHHTEDHVILMDLGIADMVKPKVVSLSKEFQLVEKEPIIV